MKPATHEQALANRGGPPLVLRLRPVVELSGEQLLMLSSINRDLRLELSAEGELIVMPPPGTGTGGRNAELTMQLRLWAKQDGTGTTFDSSTGFALPNGAVRSPDASWVLRSRLDALTEELRQKFAPLCPDFVVELRSPSDSLRVARDKMREYVENGARLGWLVDPSSSRVYVYRPGTPVQEVEAPEKISGDPVLPGFVRDLREVW